MKKLAIISIILDHPDSCQQQFNSTVAGFKGMVKGRMGIRITDEISTIAITVIGQLDDINALTGKLGNIPGVMVNASIFKKEMTDE